MNKDLLIIFAKAPVAGEVNTRLIPGIGVDAATALQHDLIMHRMQQFGDAGSFDVQLACAPDTQHELFVTCRDAHGVELVEQRGEDLGARMAHAFEDALDVYDRVVLIGTDAPTVDQESVTQAFGYLRDVDVVLQPAEDGGYVLVAMKRFWPVLFHAVPWGTERVLRKTRSNIVAAGLKWHELDVTWDIDTVDDYQRYRQQFSDSKIS